MLKRKCSRCEGNEFRRLNRIGFMERRVLPFFGFFPWECALCRTKVFLHTDGQTGRRRTRRQAALSDD